MQIPGLISLLKLPISIQELILIVELIPISESILITVLEQIGNPRSISIPEPIPDLILELTARSTSESTPESNPTSESGRFDSELPTLVQFYELGEEYERDQRCNEG